MHTDAASGCLLLYVTVAFISTIIFIGIGYITTHVLGVVAIVYLCAIASFLVLVKE